MNNDYFSVRRANNGWVLMDKCSPYNMNREAMISDEYVFRTLDEMNEWLKAKYEVQQAA